MFSQSFVPTQNNLAAVQHTLGLGCKGSNDGMGIEIRADSGGFPDSTVIGFSDSTEKGFVQTSTFDPPVSLTPGETYHMVHYCPHPQSQFSGHPHSVYGGDGYPMGQAYSTDEAGNWQIGAPRGSSGDLVETDFIIKTFYTGFHEAPIAIISDEFKIAWANETVTLDGSSSYDPDGTIVSYEWVSLPSGGRRIGNGVDPIVEYNAQGYAQEVIQLRVTDDKGGVATDTIDIWHPLVLK